MNALLIHPADDVAVVTEAVRAGGAVTFRDGGAVRSVTAAEDIPVYHKVAVRDVAAGERVRKYAQPIGVARTAIRAGEHVHCHNLASPEEKEAP